MQTQTTTTTAAAATTRARVKKTIKEINTASSNRCSPCKHCARAFCPIGTQLRLRRRCTSLCAWRSCALCPTRVRWRHLLLMTRCCVYSLCALCGLCGLCVRWLGDLAVCATGRTNIHEQGYSTGQASYMIDKIIGARKSKAVHAKVQQQQAAYANILAKGLQPKFER